MNERILKKQLGMKSTMKLRDLYGATTTAYKELYDDMNKWVDIERGDFVFIISFKPPKLKRYSKKLKEKND